VHDDKEISKVWKDKAIASEEKHISRAINKEYKELLWRGIKDDVDHLVFCIILWEERGGWK
jgi:hypothetical protein